MMHAQKLGPGDRVEVQCDLRSWADLGVPGRYTIDATHDGVIVRDGEMPRAAADQANRWDSRATGRGSIVVR